MGWRLRWCRWDGQRGLSPTVRKSRFHPPRATSTSANTCARRWAVMRRQFQPFLPRFLASPDALLTAFSRGGESPYYANELILPLFAAGYDVSR
ncbi:hypothetical protein KCP70_11025 [Salmonella enterica subsp. enterica]|nr:hypothetical protein KCP70_11025 [Salmonella enterica subsp. enterica]